jgi:thiol-disulfide isomerase/thioredoxin
VSRRAAIGALILLLAAAAAGFFAYRWLEHRNAPAPELGFTDLDGKPHALSEFRGKLTLVNFWASWCAPCLHEMPLLVKAQADYGARGLQIVGPAVDAPAAVRDIVKKFGIPYPVFVGDDEVVKAMEALGNDMGVLPYSVLIAPDGKILERIYGGLSAERLQALLEADLAKP